MTSKPLIYHTCVFTTTRPNKDTICHIHIWQQICVRKGKIPPSSKMEMSFFFTQFSSCLHWKFWVQWLFCQNDTFNPQTAKILSSHKGPTWASEAHLAFLWLYEKCIIKFYPYSFALIIFRLVFVEINIIHNIYFIVTNIHMYIAL